MAIPSNPTVTEIVTEGLKLGGRVSPTSTQISDTTARQFRAVKSDITMMGNRVDVLLTQIVSATTPYVTRFAWPTDAAEIRSVQLVECPADLDWSGDATAGGATSITLDTGLDVQQADLRGRTIFITGGTGVGQFRNITAWDNSTKVATVDSAWVTNPASGSDYLIESGRHKLWETDKPQWYDTLDAPWTNGRPIHATMVGRELWVDYAPDRTYALFWDYWAHLDRIDEAGTMFIKHLREYQNLWLQGVAVKVMQRYDEDRYLSEWNIYTNMLTAYKGEEADIGQVQYRDVG